MSNGILMESRGLQLVSFLLVSCQNAGLGKQHYFIYQGFSVRRQLDLAADDN